MTRFFITTFLFTISYILLAQKKPLDHTVYDGWQHIGEQVVSNDGNWIVYTIDPQQGDNELVIQTSDAKNKVTVPRGYNALITEDSRYVVFKIKPFFTETREAKIKKKKADELPKDSLGIVELGKEQLWKIAGVKNFKTPEKSAGWVAYLLEKKTEPAVKSNPGESPAVKKITDSLHHIIDSLEQVIESIPQKKKRKREEGEDLTNAVADFAEGDETGNSSAEAGTDLVVRNLAVGEEKTFPNVLEYYFSKTDHKLLIEKAKNPKDSTSSALILLYDLEKDRLDTLSRGGNSFKNFTMTDDGSQIAYVAERDAKPKELQKFYRLWYYTSGLDSAILLADRTSEGMQLGLTISEYANLNFSHSGNRLFFGTAPLQPPKDTTLVDFEHSKVDIWHYNDDYLQPMQLTPNRLRAALQQSYLAVYDFMNKSIQQLGSEEIPQVIQTNEGDGEQFIGVTDYGKRIELQWTGTTRKDIYAIHVKDGSKKLVKKDLLGVITPQYISPTGSYIMWYDSKEKNYFVWDGNSIKNITKRLKYPLWNEEHDSPSDPPPYGVMGWQEGDAAVYIYDRYDVWKVDPAGMAISENTTRNGRSELNTYRYLKTDPEEKFLENKQGVLLRYQNQKTKMAGISTGELATKILLKDLDSGPFIFNAISKAQNVPVYIFTKENFVSSPDLYVIDQRKSAEVKLSSINPQQADYLWGTAELFKWKAYNGKEATGILYKPENFNPNKKYPMITYFYEELSYNLYDYKEPAPIRSAINVPFFVSRGYMIFLPDIKYTTGHPGRNAYDYIVSGAKALVKKGWADSTNLAIQGHSWGGYQAAQLATMTKLFKAVWAGAPVANMTSAYGGIRWESGMNRQFQYEKTQSRIGATLWEKPDLYIENSPLFHLNKVTAPMVIMANDGDGAVPWYQGIELFTGLRRLGKKVWMFNYNGQGHGLTQRQDMVDYQIRMQQFFDWILKGEKPAKWIINGVPAADKGKEWGLELVD